MIHANRIVTVGDQESIIDRPIVLYRGDREVEIEFTLVGNEFTFSEEGNVIKSVNASHGQLVLNTPSGEHMFSELAECHEGKVVFVVTKEMIDEFIEMGFYSFQIRLYDSAEMKSRVTIPPVMNGFDIRNPIAAEDETNVVDQGIVDYARIFKDQSNEELPTFTWDGEYVKTEWAHHDVITENKLNKIEDALYSINANVKESDVVMLNTLDQVKKDADAYVKEHIAEVEADVDEFERNLNTDVQQFKIDTNAAMTAFSGEIESMNSQLAEIENEKITYVNVKNCGAKGDGVTDDTEAIQYAVNNYKTIFFPTGTYIISNTIRESTNGGARQLIGENQISTIIKASASMVDKPLIWFGNSNGHGNYRGGIQNITFNGNNKTTNGIRYHECGTSYIRDVRVMNCNIAIEALGCIHFTIEGNMFIENSNYGVRLSTIPKGTPSSIDDITITASPLDLNPNISKIKNVWFTGITNTVLYVSGGSCIIEGCTFQGCPSGGSGQYAIHLKSANESYSYGGGSWVNNCWFESGSYSFAVCVDNTNQAKVTNCYFSGHGASHEGGILLKSSPNAIIKGNNFRGTYSAEPTNDRLANGCIYVDKNTKLYLCDIDDSNYYTKNTLGVYYEGVKSPSINKSRKPLWAVVENVDSNMTVVDSVGKFIYSITRISTGKYAIQYNFNRQTEGSHRYPISINVFNTETVGCYATVYMQRANYDRVAFRNAAGELADPAGFFLMLFATHATLY